MSARAQVLLIAPVLELSGAERVVAELARRLPEHGFETSVLCLENPDAAVGVELNAAGIPVAGLRISRRRTLACARGIVEHIRRNFSKQKLMLCAQLYHANIAARLALRNLTAAERSYVRLCTTIQVAERRFRPWQFALDRLTACYGVKEICVAASVADFQQQKTGLPADYFRVIENGTDLSRYALLNRKRSAVSGEAARVVSVGRLDRQKDFPTLLRAWQAVEARGVPGILEIAGSGALERPLKRLCDRLKLKRCKFTGFCSDVPAFLDGAALFVQSSAWEGLPLAVMEALAAGVPVIASAVDSLPVMLEENVSGWLFRRGDAQQLADKICMALTDRAHAIEVAEIGRTRALERFSAERMAREYAALFQEILETVN